MVRPGSGIKVVKSSKCVPEHHYPWVDKITADKYSFLRQYDCVDFGAHKPNIHAD